MNNILVTRSSMPSFEEYCEEIKDIWDSHWLTNMGVKHKELQKELENYLGIPHVALYTNGHLALENAIAALNLPKGGEVITTPFTFASTTHAIVRNGLVPVFCDIKEDDYTIDTQKLENLITDNTVAIVPVHVYGNMCDVEEIDRIAKKYGLKVIYDAAHAFAVKYKGVSSENKKKTTWLITSISSRWTACSNSCQASFAASMERTIPITAFNSSRHPFASIRVSSFGTRVPP